MLLAQYPATFLCPLLNSVLTICQINHTPIHKKLLGHGEVQSKKGTKKTSIAFFRLEIYFILTKTMILSSDFKIENKVLETCSITRSTRFG